MPAGRGTSENAAYSRSIAVGTDTTGADTGSAYPGSVVEGELSYDDDSFDEPDPDIQRMFYGTTMLLLDSQVTLWVMDDNPRLGRRARTEVVSASHVHVSAATVWEPTIKSMLGKIVVPDRLSGRLEDHGFTLLSITAENAEGILGFPGLARHDPFDRLIVAQAERTGLRLLTADTVLLDLKRPVIVDARE